MLPLLYQKSVTGYIIVIVTDNGNGNSLPVMVTLSSLWHKTGNKLSSWIYLLTKCPKSVCYLNVLDFLQSKNTNVAPAHA